MTTRTGRQLRAASPARNPRRSALAGVVLALSGTALGGAQAPPPANARPADWVQRSKNFETSGLAQPFTGVTTDGTVVPKLFAARSTGVSTAPVVTAAKAFLASLSAPQRTKTLFPVDDPNGASG